MHTGNGGTNFRHTNREKAIPLEDPPVMNHEEQISLSGGKQHYHQNLALHQQLPTDYQKFLQWD